MNQRFYEKMSNEGFSKTMNAKKSSQNFPESSYSSLKKRKSQINQMMNADENLNLRSTNLEDMEETP